MKKNITVFVLIMMIGLSNLGFSQELYKVQDTQDINMRLLGTSTLHDWEMDAKKATGEARFQFLTNQELEIESVKSLTFKMAVKDLQSDSKGLDKNAYKALKSDKYKDIYYNLSSSTLSGENGTYLLKTNGKLTIAGITKEIVMEVHIVLNKNQTITCKGSYELKMTDFEVIPPSFMMGMMKTGDAATLDFTVVYKKVTDA